MSPYPNDTTSSAFAKSNNLSFMASLENISRIPCQERTIVARAVKRRDPNAKLRLVRRQQVPNRLLNRGYQVESGLRFHNRSPRVRAAATSGARRLRRHQKQR